MQSPYSAQREAADGVFRDAAEIKSAVVFYDVCYFGVAVGGAVLEVVDDASVLIEGDDEGVALRNGLEEFGETNDYFAQEGVGQHAVQDCVAWGHQSQPELVAPV